MDWTIHVPQIAKIVGVGLLIAQIAILDIIYIEVHAINAPVNAKPAKFILIISIIIILAVIHLKGDIFLIHRLGKNVTKIVNQQIVMVVDVQLVMMDITYQVINA